MYQFGLSLGLRAQAIFLSFLWVVTYQPAQAQQNDCVDYAQKMEIMEQARQALGPLPEDQTRQAHQSWCEGAPTAHPRAHFERQIRDFHAFARSISIRHLNPNFRCETYAVASNAFEEALTDLGCPIQTSTQGQHRDWCEAGNRNEAIDHLTTRRQNLLRCIAAFDYQGPGGAPRNFSSQQNGSGASGGRQPAALPGGLWRQTCTDIQYNGDIIRARCLNNRGRYRQTSYQYRGGPLVNCNGEFYGTRRCPRGSEVQPSDYNASGITRQVYDPPAGSYRSSCRNAAVEEGTLFAECRNQNGRFQRSTLFIGNYTGPISNCDGTLRRVANCDRARSTTQPEGSYKQSCRNIRVQSGTLYASCRNARGQYRDTELDIRGYGGSVSNCNGRLRRGTSC